MHSTPACQIDAAKLRDLEKQLTLYRQEDSDLHRQIRSLESAHQTALMRAEESGYAKGLREYTEAVNLLSRANECLKHTGYRETMSFEIGAWLKGRMPGV
jgi:hypothetical protein